MSSTVRKKRTAIPSTTVKNYQTPPANATSVRGAGGRLRLNDDDEIVTNAEEPDDEGTTNVAPGTELTVRVRPTTRRRLLERRDNDGCR